MKKVLFAAVAIVLAAACNRKETPTIFDHQWQLDEVMFADNEFSETPPEGITLSFDDSLKLASGRGGCNRYVMPFKAGDDYSLSFGMPMATQMACPDMEFEQRYLLWMSQIENYSLGYEDLRLEGGGVTLVYKPEFKAAE